MLKVLLGGFVLFQIHIQVNANFVQLTQYEVPKGFSVKRTYEDVDGNTYINNLRRLVAMIDRLISRGRVPEEDEAANPESSGRGIFAREGNLFRTENFNWTYTKSWLAWKDIIWLNAKYRHYSGICSFIRGATPQVTRTEDLAILNKAYLDQGSAYAVMRVHFEHGDIVHDRSMTTYSEMDDNTVTWARRKRRALRRTKRASSWHDIEKSYVHDVRALNLNDQNKVSPVPAADLENNTKQMCVIPGQATNILDINFSPNMNRFETENMRYLKYIRNLIQEYTNKLVSEGFGAVAPSDEVDDTDRSSLMPDWFVEASTLTHIWLNAMGDAKDYVRLEDSLQRLEKIARGISTSINLAKTGFCDLGGKICRISLGPKSPCIQKDLSVKWVKVEIQPIASEGESKVLDFTNYFYKKEGIEECGLEVGGREGLSRLSSTCCRSLAENKGDSIEKCPTKVISDEISYRNYQRKDFRLYSTAEVHGCKGRLDGFERLTVCPTQIGEDDEAAVMHGDGDFTKILTNLPSFQKSTSRVFYWLSIGLASTIGFSVMSTCIFCLNRRFDLFATCGCRTISPRLPRFGRGRYEAPPEAEPTLTRTVANAPPFDEITLALTKAGKNRTTSPPRSTPTSPSSMGVAVPTDFNPQPSS